MHEKGNKVYMLKLQGSYGLLEYSDGKITYFIILEYVTKGNPPIALHPSACGHTVRVVLSLFSSPPIPISQTSIPSVTTPNCQQIVCLTCWDMLRKRNPVALQPSVSAPQFYSDFQVFLTPAILLLQTSIPHAPLQKSPNFIYIADIPADRSLKPLDNPDQILNLTRYLSYHIKVYNH